MSRKVNLSGQEVVTAKQHNEALAHAKNLIKEQANRIAELEGLHKELLYEVDEKYPNETRHETARRWLRERRERPSELSKANAEATDEGE